ncbi:MAG: META domain-containing protein [Terricaulis sp.]
MKRTAFVLLALLAACAGKPLEQSPPPLAGTRWVMVVGAGSDQRAPTLEIGERRAAGFAGCNTWFASVSQQGETLSFGIVGATRMACAPEAMSLERDFVGALGATRFASRDGERLLLLDIDRRPLARFAPMR